MTGYGKAEYIFSDHKTIVELRAVNSKQLDLTLKLYPQFKDKEADIRAMLTQPLERGKVDVAIYQQPVAGEQLSSVSAINWALAKEYAAQYKEQMNVENVPDEVMAAIVA